MRVSKIAGLTVLTLVSLVVLGILGSLGTENELFRSSQWATPALVSGLVVVVSVCVFGLLGRPWQKWARTPYW